jgi:hypothetical protein
LEQASPDLLRAMLQTFAEALMSADADAVCGAPYGQVSEDRVNRRNGYRDRRWDTRAGTEPVALFRAPVIRGEVATVPGAGCGVIGTGDVVRRASCDWQAWRFRRGARSRGGAGPVARTC